MEGRVEVTVGRATCEASSSTWNLSTNSPFAPGPSTPTQTLKTELNYIVTCRGVRATKMTGSSSDDWIYWHLVTASLNHIYCSVIATVPCYTLGCSVFTSRILTMEIIPLSLPAG
jgi:hypothetical protein